MALALLSLAWLAAGPARAAFPGENGRIAFTKSSDIWVMNPNGSGKVRLTCGGRASQPAWSPDGQKIAFNRGWRGIGIMDPHGSNPLSVDPSGVMPVWSPTGQRIAFLLIGPRPDGHTTVGVVNADGSDRQEFFSAPTLSSQAWSPDGQRLVSAGVILDPDTGEEREFGGGGLPAWSSTGVIAFTRGFPSGDIWTSNPDGSEETQLTDTADREEGPLWSPDGRRIAFWRSGDLWVMDADGSDQTRLANGGHLISYVWSPDGQQIAFSRSAGTGSDIWVISADGSDQTLLAEGGLGPDWQPLPAGASLGPPPSQFCFEGLRRNTKRGIARLVVDVPRPGRVVLRPRPGVKRLAQAHRDEGRGWVALKVRPRGKARQRLNRKSRVRVRAQVTYRPWVGEPRTKGRRVWLVKR